MPEISQAMIGALQEAMAQLTAAVSSLTSTASTLLAHKADKTELISLSDKVETDVKQQKIDLQTEIELKVADLKSVLIKEGILKDAL